LLVNILNIRKCKVWIGVKFLLLDFINFIITKEEITLWSSTLRYFLGLLIILAIMIMLIALCYITWHYISNFRSLCICLVAIAIRRSPLRQAPDSRLRNDRNELLQFADRCNKLLELSLGNSPSPLFPDITHPHIFFMTSGTACSSILFTYFVFFVTPVLWVILVAMALLTADTQYITAHACQHVKSLRFCRWQVSGKFVPVAEATFMLRIFGSRAEPSGAVFSIGPLIFLRERFNHSSKYTKRMTVPAFLNSSQSCYWTISYRVTLYSCIQEVQILNLGYIISILRFFSSPSWRMVGYNVQIDLPRFLPCSYTQCHS
jgi:hypothetical protein